MDDDTQHRSSSTLWVVAIFGLPLVYLLSTGPVVRMTMSKSYLRGGPDWVETFYEPVDWLHDHTPLEKPLEWYMDWWLKGASQP